MRSATLHVVATRRAVHLGIERTSQRYVMNAAFRPITTRSES
jgi:hypothetical protein